MITLPIAFEEALGFDVRDVEVTFILTISGLPTAYVYGSTPIDIDTWWAGQPENTKPARILRSFNVDTDTGLPTQLELSDSQLDIINGRSDMGTLNLELIDVDDELVALKGIRNKAGWRRLFDTMEPWQISFTLDSHAGLELGDILFIDREAMRIDDIDSFGSIIVTRGWYGSRPERHGGDDVYGPGHGAIVTTYPRVINEREARLWCGYNAQKLSDCVPLFHGEIRTYADGGDTAVAALKCEDGQSRLKKPLFKNIFRGWFNNPENPPSVGWIPYFSGHASEFNPANTSTGRRWRIGSGATPTMARPTSARWVTTSVSSG
jgi:hypothetical protein